MGNYKSIDRRKDLLELERKTKDKSKGYGGLEKSLGFATALEWTSLLTTLGVGAYMAYATDFNQEKPSNEEVYREAVYNTLLFAVSVAVSYVAINNTDRIWIYNWLIRKGWEERQKKELMKNEQIR